MAEKWMKKLAKPMLFAAAFIWGSSFFVMKNSLDALPVQYLLALRFTTGAVLLGLLCGKHWRSLRADYLWQGAVMGVLMYLAYSVQTYGLALTTPSKNAFLTTIYCVIVPFFYWWLGGVRPDRYNLSAALLCVAGIGLVSLSGDLTVNAGDALTLASAVFYAAHMVAVSRFSQGKNVMLLTVCQFAVSALCAWVGGALTETFPAAALGDRAVVLPLLYLAVMATTVALLFQNMGQANSDPVSASVILSLESVFGVLCSVLFAHDQVTVRMGIGFAMIFAAVVCSETKLSFLRRTPTK